MADDFSELDSEGVYVGMSLEDFGVRVSGRGATIMPRESLKEAIEHLKGELASGKPLSSQERTRLERVLGDVSGILDSESHVPGAASGLFDDVREFAEGFEESRPKLALVLGRIMDSLSQLGI